MPKQTNRRNPWQLGHWLPSLAVGMLLIIAGGIWTYFTNSDKDLTGLKATVAVQQVQIQDLENQVNKLWEARGKK